MPACVILISRFSNLVQFSDRDRSLNVFLQDDVLKVAPYSYTVSVHILFEGLLFLLRESCGVET